MIKDTDASLRTSRGVFDERINEYKVIMHVTHGTWQPASEFATFVVLHAQRTPLGANTCHGMCTVRISITCRSWRLGAKQAAKFWYSQIAPSFSPQIAYCYEKLKLEYSIRMTSGCSPCTGPKYVRRPLGLKTTTAADLHAHSKRLTESRRHDQGSNGLTCWSWWKCIKTSAALS